MKAKVLIVDDDISMCELLAEGLAQQGYEARWKASPHDALGEIEQRNFDVVLTDINMRDMNGLELCQRATEAHPDLPVIVITAFGSMETAVQAIRAGAYDFITKPFDIDVVAIALERAVKHGVLTREVQRLQRAVDESRRFDELLGASPAMKEVYDLLERVAESESTVLVSGESGTGKELVARALHRRSKRASGPFVAINCAAMPEQLLESELFGHTKGAFTDARTARPGLFVQAKGGTIFLDEIGDMPLGLQPKLLRALQERTVRPVGGDHETLIDVRVVAASNRDLETAIEERKFREDLYYRINVIHVELPPLRARGADVLLLAQHYLEHFAAQSQKDVRSLDPEAAERLSAYAWPGNVRELANCMERAVALTRGESVGSADLPEKIRNYRTSHVLVAATDPSELVPLEEVEKRYILRVLEAVGGNKTLAAQVLGLDRKTLYRKLDRYGAERNAS
ncbi:MAG TPA: sigma-54 dependent transcriptional regulator [Polyangiaceae bacterium]|jgi:two-component system response regulator HydG|nr:sigma-54 dependent transcriptional regulator [Polyangiaceae bacterium]